MNIGFAGKFTIHKQKVQMQDGVPLLDKDGNQVLIGKPEKVAEFENLITNGGLNRLGTGNAIDFCYLSSDNAEPNVSDSTLSGFLGGSKTSAGSGYGAYSVDTPPYFTSINQTYRFAAGVATGNISKIGTGWGNSGSISGLWSVALVKDINGNNATITKLPEEILDITYELRTYIPSEDFTGTVTISGVTYNAIVRAANISQVWGGLSNSINPTLNFNTATMHGVDIGSIKSQPSSASQSASQITKESYVNNSMELGFKVSAVISQANFTGGVRSFLVRYNSANQWQVSLSRASDGAAIPKTSEYSLTMPTLKIKWGRYVAP